MILSGVFKCTSSGLCRTFFLAGVQYSPGVSGVILNPIS